MYTSKYSFLCMQPAPILTVLWFSEVLPTISNFCELALCDILETSASVFVLGHRVVTHDTTFCMNDKS